MTLAAARRHHPVYQEGRDHLDATTLETAALLWDMIDTAVGPLLPETQKLLARCCVHMTMDAGTQRINGMFAEARTPFMTLRYEQVPTGFGRHRT